VSCVAGYIAYSGGFGFVLYIDVVMKNSIYIDAFIDRIIELAEVAKVYAFGESADFDGVAAILCGYSLQKAQKCEEKEKKLGHSANKKMGVMEKKALLRGLFAA
jgi:uncharacterized protein YggL (DUF469 family)